LFAPNNACHFEPNYNYLSCRPAPVDAADSFGYRQDMNMIVPDQGKAEIDISQATGASDRPVTITAAYNWRGGAAMAATDLLETFRLWLLVWILSLLDIRLRGLFGGFNDSQIKQMQADVAAFADLDQFLELPVRTYSSGMVIRLGFALTTAVKPQTLLMDEWILAGDASFLDKARHRLETMVRGAEILVLSSHSAEIIMRWCNRVIWMEAGQIKADGPPEQVLAAYLPPEQFAQAKASASVAA
jgi:ABC-type uncharacterized transport system ATPase subunit